MENAFVLAEILTQDVSEIVDYSLGLATTLCNASLSGTELPLHISSSWAFLPVCWYVHITSVLVKFGGFTCFTIDIIKKLFTVALGCRRAVADRGWDYDDDLAVQTYCFCCRYSRQIAMLMSIYKCLKFNSQWSVWYDSIVMCLYLMQPQWRLENFY